MSNGIQWDVKRAGLSLLLVLLVACGSSSSSHQESARCGDGHIDLGEECDGAELAGRTCANFGGDPGRVLACSASCRFDVSGCEASMCGNGRLDRRHLTAGSISGTCEPCDGGVSTLSCAALGGSGTLPCNESCFGAGPSQCDRICGNGRLEPDEPCEVDPATEAPVFSEGITCESLGRGRGTLGCSVISRDVSTPFGTEIAKNCVVDVTACEVDATNGVCGDGHADLSSGEDCDGADLGFTCEQLGLTGTLQCGPDCRFDFSECGIPPGPAQCGNGIVEEGEECDGAWFAPVPSESRLLQCAREARFTAVDICSDCRVDLDRCSFKCGDGLANGFDECDGDDLRGVTCADLGGNGALRCSPYCFLDRSGCEGVPGNGRREDDEVCDSDFPVQDLGGASCESLGYGDGRSPVPS
jgi:hypothetical protein